MDYSTISNKTACTEIEDLTDGELNERYYSIKKQFDNLSSVYEATKQELHDSRRACQTALDVQSHLSAELEAYQAEEGKLTNELKSRLATLQDELTTLRLEAAQATECHDKELKGKEDEIRRLKEEQAVRVERVTPDRDNSELDEARVALQGALSDAVAAKVALEEAQIEMMSWKMRTEELVNEMGEMRAAADLRREELRAANERENTALAELAEAKAMLHQFTISQDLEPHAAKGNSIFAEVEDKRQEMAKNLIQMKQTNSRLRRELANKQSELETLLHEKQTIWEQQVGATAHYDRELIDSYSERITQLEGLCETQRRELARWFGRLCEPTALGWLPGVLDHLKSECEKLRAEVLSRGAGQLASAAQVRELRRKIALLTSNNNKQPSISPPKQDESLDIGHKVEICMKPLKVRPTPDDVKKKVQFN